MSLPYSAAINFLKIAGATLLSFTLPMYRNSGLDLNLRAKPDIRIVSRRFDLIGSYAVGAGRRIREDRILPVAAPERSCFKGYEDFRVRELEVRAPLIRYRRERWVTPDGRTLVAPLPAGITRHLGPKLQRFILFQ